LAREAGEDKNSQELIDKDVDFLSVFMTTPKVSIKPVYTGIGKNGSNLVHNAFLAAAALEGTNKIKVTISVNEGALPTKSIDRCY
jgi:hypothetical protein